MEFDDLSHRVIGCAIEVHRALGLGYLSQRMSSVLLTNCEEQYPVPAATSAASPVRRGNQAIRALIDLSSCSSRPSWFNLSPG